MKRVIIFLSIIIGVTMLTYAMQQQQPQQQKTFKLENLTEEEVIIIYQAIDDAAIEGAKRKPLLQKIATQYQAQKADTTKLKPSKK